ncbi:hypothetical protein V5O48_019211 [Marasmius crinis-equi]|uniref:Uncharacterized protein n=1 Tax=Marasmius crinis-equi TaxID=585013 RepID=A0ABR3EJ04_9AGAR
MVHIPAHRQHRRQGGLVETPTGSGLGGVQTVQGSPTETDTTLAFDASATGRPEAGNAGPSFSLATTLDSTTPTSSASSTPTASAESSATSSQIPLGTVIGACVGALAGAILIVCVGLWLFKRADPKKKKRRGPQRDAQGRPPSSWNKLDDEDTWEGKGTKARGMEMVDKSSHLPISADYQKDSMEKMFKKSTPSIRTEYTIKTDLEHLPPFNINLDNHPFAQYHPNLAKELASAPAEPDPRPPFMNLERVQSGSQWDGDSVTVGHNSFLSLNSGKRVSGAMSPSLDMAIPTPPATSAGASHRWESAEVLDFEGQAAEIVHPPPAVVARDGAKSNNPFLTERRKSDHNPFFGAQHTSRTPSNKGKKREITPSTATESTNPFADQNMTHVKVDSLSSVTSNDRAIQSLLAALDATPAIDDPRHPSMQSAVSAYSTEDVTGSFPLPPGAVTKH